MGGECALKATIGGIICGVVLVVIVGAWAFWQSSSVEDTITEANIDGSGNLVKTESSHEWNLIHINNLRSDAVKRTWVWTVMFILLFAVIIGYACHYRLVRKPRNEIKYEEQEQKDVKLEDMEYELIEGGYLKRKKRKRKISEKTRKKEVKTKKMRVNKRREERIEEDDEEEEEV
jgi:flagellar biosynthesis/type III secretory pathway M-ring protein FliF/YscJ